MKITLRDGNLYEPTEGKLSKDVQEEPTETEAPVEEDGEDVELDVSANEEVVEVPAEDKFTNDLDPAEKK